MTAEGASSQDGPTRARAWQAVRRLSSRTSLRTKLITALITLVILALAAISCAGISILRGYLIGQTDTTLRGQGLEQLAVHAVNDSLSNNGCGGSGVELANSKYAVWWIPAGGAPEQVVQPVVGGFSNSCTGNGSSGPSTSAISAVASQLAANPGLTTTVPGQASGDRWRVISYSEPVTNGTTGIMIIGTDVSNVYGTIQQLAGVDLIVSIAIVLVLLMAAIAVVRANLRPLVEIEETAEEIADGHLNRRVPEHDPRTEIGRLGRSLNIMLSQIETAFHAREESEAAAHQSEERMRRFIADASHELRTPLTAIRGFAEYYRQRGGLVTYWDKAASASASADEAGSRVPAMAGGADAGRPGPDHAAGGEGSGPDGLARRGPAAAGPA